MAAREQDLRPAEEPVHMQAEFPVAGTSLNPVEETWAFDYNAAAAPQDELARAMQQGE
ncbi:hypothetical protein [Brevibacillus sp. H7]|uniref:hypothetical protein n=1 Tax=Brevibacillus sp. H7 TaxID=3349138 RepID=UPI003816B4F3